MTKPVAATGEDGRHLYTCPLCEAMCGLEIEVSDGKVASIRGNRDDTWSRGHICPKGATLGALHEDPDRIRRPMVKVDGQWQEVSWDAAFRRCTELLTPVIEEHGIGAVTCYTGNPLAHSFSLGRYTGVLLGMSGIPLSYSPGTVDQWPKNLSSHLMYGGWWSFPVPDVERTDLLVVMGANPAASQGSLLAAPDVMGMIDANPQAWQGDRDRPGAHRAPPRAPTSGCRSRRAPTPRCCWPSPTRSSPRISSTSGTSRRTSTASTRCARSPRTGPRSGSRPSRTSTPNAFAAWRANSPPPRRAVVYGRIGLCNQEFGSLASWLVDVVNILLRPLRRRRAVRCSRGPAAWSVTVQPMPGLEDGAPEFGRFRTRVRGAKEVLGQVPVSCLAEEIATPGDGQIKALITVAGNPVLSTPGGPQARRGAAEAGCDDHRRPVAQRDHPARRRDPARARRRSSSRTTTT